MVRRHFITLKRGYFSRLQHPDLIFTRLGKPEGVVGTHHHAEGEAGACRNRIQNKMVGRDIEPRNRVFRRHRNPYLTFWADDQAIDAASTIACMGGVVRCKYPALWIEAEQEACVE